jgi:hypothetical protein
MQRLLIELANSQEQIMMASFDPPASAQRRRAGSARLIRRIAASASLLVVLSAAATLALPTKALPAALADTATSVCGQEVANVDPSYDLAGLLQMTQQGNNQIISAIVNGTGLGAQWCGPVQWITEVAAEVVADGALLDIVNVQTPQGLDIAVAVAKSLIEQAQQGQGATLPDVGGFGTAVWAPVAWATAGIYIRPEPDTSAPPIGSVPNGVPLLLQCSIYGQSVTSAGGTTSVWDQVTYDGVTGYVADAFINTGQLTPAVPGC